MEFFPHDSIDHPVTVNGLRPNTFNFEFEGADHGYFTAAVFCHELGHSLHLPDHYHYVNYREVTPSGTWDLMCNNHEGANHTTKIGAVMRGCPDFCGMCRPTLTHPSVRCAATSPNIGEEFNGGHAYRGLTPTANMWRPYRAWGWA